VSDAIVRDVPTSQGLARLHCFSPGPAGATAASSPGSRPRGTVLLGHGAGGGVDAADLAALTALTQHGWAVALLEQPWRVAGRRIAVAPSRLDEATEQMLGLVGRLRCAPRPWVLGGRSAGARVACRLRGHAEALCLIAFPLAPPPRGGRSPAPRTDELLAPLREGIPTLVMQGERDRFGGPTALTRAVGAALEHQRSRPCPDQLGLRVRGYPGDHGPSRDLPALVNEVGAFLDALP